MKVYDLYSVGSAALMDVHQGGIFLAYGELCLIFGH